MHFVFTLAAFDEKLCRKEKSQGEQIVFQATVFVCGRELMPMQLCMFAPTFKANNTNTPPCSLHVDIYTPLVSVITP